MSDDVLKFRDQPEEYDHDLDDGLVLCARCGASIPGTSTRCPKCRVHFHGQAQDFFHPSEQSPTHARGFPWVIAIAVVVVLALIIAVLA
jgi:hypothetical protein